MSSTIPPLGPSAYIASSMIDTDAAYFSDLSADFVQSLESAVPEHSREGFTNGVVELWESFLLEYPYLASSHQVHVENPAGDSTPDQSETDPSSSIKKRKVEVSHPESATIRIKSQTGTSHKIPRSQYQNYIVEAMKAAISEGACNYTDAIPHVTRIFQNSLGIDYRIEANTLRLCVQDIKRENPTLYTVLRLSSREPQLPWNSEDDTVLETAALFVLPEGKKGRCSQHTYQQITDKHNELCTPERQRKIGAIINRLSRTIFKSSQKRDAEEEGYSSSDELHTQNPAARYALDKSEDETEWTTKERKVEVSHPESATIRIRSQTGTSHKIPRSQYQDHIVEAMKAAISEGACNYTDAIPHVTRIFQNSLGIDYRIAANTLRFCVQDIRRKDSTLYPILKLSRKTHQLSWNSEDDNALKTAVLFVLPKGKKGRCSRHTYQQITDKHNELCAPERQREIRAIINRLSTTIFKNSRKLDTEEESYSSSYE